MGDLIRPDDVREMYGLLVERPADFLGVLIEWEGGNRE
jgi:hypothetical protein